MPANPLLHLRLHFDRLLWVESSVFSHARFPFFYHCLYTVYILKNIKSGSHDIIHVFKNYFVTVFSVFSFSNNKLNPSEPITTEEEREKRDSWSRWRVRSQWCIV